MRIGYVVNAIEIMRPYDSTTVLVHAAQRAGHTVYLIGVGELCYFPDGSVGGAAVRIPQHRYANPETMIRAVHATEARERLSFGELDVVHLRYNPSEETGHRQWAHQTPVLFGQIAAQSGTLVLNHPDTLGVAINKLYFQQFPESVRPRTLVSRSYPEIRRFFEEQGRKMILKPLIGFGGSDVFLLKDEATNLRQLVETMSKNGYIIAQEYLPEAKEGDIRMILLNGEPLRVKGQYAALRRRTGDEDIRSNITAGGHPEAVQVTDRLLELADRIRPKLIRDGLFYVGIDVVGDKLMEINAIATGNLVSIRKVSGVDFAPHVIEAIERKLYYRALYGNKMSNRELAVL